MHPVGAQVLWRIGRQSDSLSKLRGLLAGRLIQSNQGSECASS